ncbi:MAG: heavy-metal-associated domain-containing protein [Crocinitomicaceae bacterium]|jgi:copper chaperone|nr:heavy-metal-associated domain-containing protein [Crocinitomicaceae bacterium]
MKSEKLIVANIKCSGCVNTIVEKLSALEGVDHVNVDQADKSVTVFFEGDLKREVLINRLQEIGYPAVD